jgi:pimeloyl-ACP methyl ester carboxylesterase
MIRGENMCGTPGLLLLEPYDPDRVPVIFVHGLLSSSFIWRSTALGLLQDPEIRRRYQFWIFSYPTGNPISFSGLRLREDLGFVQERFGPQHGIVLIGHSVGGLLSRILVTTSGRTIWDEIFDPRAQKLYREVPNGSRAKGALIFEANPAVSRVIFIATPHRGSAINRNDAGTAFRWKVLLDAIISWVGVASFAYIILNEYRGSVHSILPFALSLFFQLIGACIKTILSWRRKPS